MSVTSHYRGDAPKPSPVALSRHGAVGVITVDNPPVNALGAAVRDGLLACLDEALADDAVSAIVLIGAGRTFIAGADIKEFGKPFQGTDLNALIGRYERSPKPIVAAIHGAALGGGLEVAMSCNYRVALAAARVGLPEVKLGILPGAGGTQRLPRLAGPEIAVSMITTGESAPADQAAKLGILDAVFKDDLLGSAIVFAQEVASRDHHPVVRDLDAKIAAARGAPEMFERARKTLGKSARGQFAPLKCVDAVEAAVNLAFEDGLARERELFRECFESGQRKALVYAFFSEREASKIPGLPADAATRPIARVGVIGAGTMGGGIAMNFVNAGVPVTILEAETGALDRGLERVRGNYAATVAKGKLAQSALDQRMALLHPTTDYADLAEVDLVIEAVFERMDVKKDVFAKLDRVIKPGAILATNTSTLDIDEIARSIARPADVVGLHFFSPANVMRLLEIVRGAATAPDVLATSLKLAKMIGKVGVVAGVCDGFIGNRMIAQYGREAEFLLAEGATPQQVDAAIYNFGFAMGPLAMGDLAGLDIGWDIRKRRVNERPTNLRTSTIADRVCEMGRFGQKTGAGYYRYDKGDRTPHPDPAIAHLFTEESARLGIARRDISDEEIVKRCVYALVNEGAKILEEGIAYRAGDIDVIYLNGYGFPAYRGGPMFYADTVGLRSVYDDVRRFEQEHGEFWTPAPLLRRLAEQGGAFTA